jgi:hypothetical protein
MGLSTVLIPETWHLIVVECDLKICIATIYGKFVKASDIFKPIARRVTFRILTGNDFVAFVDCDTALRIFEVFYPEKMQLLTKIKTQVVALGHLRDHQAIPVIEQDGQVSKLTFPQMVNKKYFYSVNSLGSLIRAILFPWKLWCSEGLFNVAFGIGTEHQLTT